MTEREKELLRMAVVYTRDKLEDVIEAFGHNDAFETNDGNIIVGGEAMLRPTDDEMDRLLMSLQ
jgi:hypothetical protein